MIFNLLRDHRLRRMFPAVLLGALTSLSLLSTQAQALSVGRIAVNSYLNEPFRATVPLTSLQPGELEQLRVELADDQAFARLGLEKSSFLTTLKFNVREGNAPDSAVVAITSREVAKEPFFGLLMEFRGLGGRIIREYTVLLDPNAGQRQRQRAAVTAAAAPGPSAAQTAPPAGQSTQAPAKPAAAPEPARADKPAAKPQPRKAKPASSAAQPAASLARAPQPFRGGDKERNVAVPSPEVFQGDKAQIEVPAAAGAVADRKQNAANQYGPVPRGMTLWQIAEKVRPNNNLSMNQVMWALYSSNQNQFDGNLNLVRRGATLQVPSAQAMRNISPGEAAALVDDQATQHKQRLARIRKQADSNKAAAASEPAASRSQAQTSAAGAKSTSSSTQTAQPEVSDLEVVEESLQEPAEEPVELVEEEQAFEDLPALPTGDADDIQDADSLSREEFEELEALPMEADETAGQSADSGSDYADLPPLPEEDAPADAASQAGSFDDSGMDTAGGSAQEAADGSSAGESGSPFGWLLAALGVLLAGVLALFALRRRSSSSDDFGPATSYPTAAAPTADVNAPSSDADTPSMPLFDEGTEPAADVTATTDLGDAGTETDIEIPDLDSLAAEDDRADLEFGDTAVFNAGANDQVSSPDMGFGDTQVYPAATDADDVETLDMPDDLDGGTQTLDLGSETVSLELNEDPLSEADFQLAYGLYDEAALLLNRAIENDPERLELHEKLAETHFAASDAEQFKQAAQSLKDKNPDAETWQRIAIMGQQLCPEDSLFAADLGADAAAGVDLDMDFDSGQHEAAPEADDVGATIEFEMPDVPQAAQPEPAAQAPADAADEHMVEFDLGEAQDDAAEPDTATSSNLEDDFDADFGSLTLDGEAGDELPDLDDLEFGDLDAELDSDDATSSATDDAPATSDSADDFGDLTLSDISDTELELDAPADDAATDLTDFDLDDLTSDDGSGASTDFDLDSLGDDASGEADLDLDDGFSLDLDDSTTEADLDLDSLSLDADDSSPAGVMTDFDLDNPVGEEPLEATAEDTDFNLDDLGESTDFNLDEPVSDTDDISGGDEAGTKLDLARAYVDMGEVDMARSLLTEVTEAGNDAQKAEAQELIGKL